MATATTVQQLIIDNLHIIASAIKTKSKAGRGANNKLTLHGINKIRQLILDLAVRGLLVPQDTSDEPASVLLEKIAAEKDELIKKGKIKKPKPLPAINDDEKPFAIPNNWRLVRLGDIIQISSGSSLISAHMNKKGNIPVFGGNGITGYHDAGNIFKKTLVIGRVGFYCGSIHITPDISWVTDNAFITCFSEKNIYIYFLEWLLKGTNLKENENATAQPVISGRKIYPIIVALPPLAEQQRIVAKVDELMVICDQLEQQQQASLETHQTLVTSLLASLTNAKIPQKFNDTWKTIAENFSLLFTTEQSIDELKKCILQLAVMGKLVPQDSNDEPASLLLEKIAAEKAELIKQGQIKRQKPLPNISDDEKPFAIPSSWQWVRLGDVGETNIGLTYKPTNISKTGIPVLRSTNIQNSKICLSNLVRVSNIKIKDNAFIKNGDLLICARNGSKNLVGKTAMINNINERMAFGVFMAIYKSCINSFAEIFLNSPIFRKNLEGIETTTINQITQSNLKLTIFPLPPLAEQQRIVAKVDELMAICDKLQQTIIAAQQTQLNLADASCEQIFR